MSDLYNVQLLRVLSNCFCYSFTQIVSPFAKEVELNHSKDNAESIFKSSKLYRSSSVKFKILFSHFLVEFVYK